MSGIQTIAKLASEKLPLVLSTVGAFLVVVILQYLLKGNPIAKIPIVGQHLGSDEKRRQAFLMRARDLYVEGYTNFKNGVFRVITAQESNVIVVSPSFLPELKSLPDDVLSFDGAISETMHVDYTHLQIGNKAVPHMIKTSLTPALVRLNPTISEEVKEWFGRELPPCDNWTSVNINHKLLRIVGAVSGRIFVGADIARSEEYLDMAINYTVDLMKARHAVDGMKPWLRPFKANSIPEVQQLKARLKSAEAIMRPIVESRQREAAEGNTEKPDDMLQWLMDVQGSTKFASNLSTERLAADQLGLTFAAIHTTTLTSTNAFYNLAADPSLADMLRTEIRTVLAEHNGILTSQALQSMKKVDSFLKETMRFDPVAANSFQRKVLRPFTLSNGQAFPAGVILEVPAHAVSRDPEVFPDPDRFDPLRFYHLRQQAREAGHVEAAAQHQFVSLSPSVLTFGYGRHACPGRFFAANEIKMILANALLMYEIRLVEGVKERYPNILFGSGSMPDPTKELLFKKLV
ncbi:cytochrome P450 [Podospora didyma]|uniref:Cytochrome P450 n=1 Tax=Podospora didyma TaxID=330526 RepID=A0AAE0TZC8_9PEZI|nr:cytochrome P450 [Podospora didyma]